MGVLNCTPDSFFDGGRYLDQRAAVEQARHLIREGADILDVGGESSRPGASPVDPSEQIRRTAPVIAAIRAFWQGPISIDTTCADVARAAIAAGAGWINDISALRDDAGMVSLAAESGSMLVLMHMQGTPRTMQAAPHYEDVVAEVGRFLAERTSFAQSRGIASDRLVIDPGIGFGKRPADNLTLLRHLPDLVSMGYPVLVGASHKSFIGHVTGEGPEGRLEGSLAAAIWAARHGAQIVRVHDVAATRRALMMASAISQAE